MSIMVMFYLSIVSANKRSVGGLFVADRAALTHIGLGVQKYEIHADILLEHSLRELTYKSIYIV